MKIAFTICSNNYLAQAKTLGDSLIKHNPDYKFVIFLVDTLSGEIDYDFFKPFEIIPIEKIFPGNFNELWQKYDIVELNTCVKPGCFKYLLQQHPDLDYLFYFDPDIMLFDSLTDLEKEFGLNNILLTPHITKPIELDKKIPSENIFLNFGIYNLGFLGLKRSDEVYQLLNWWEERTTKMGFIRVHEGIFVDQLWMNFAPVFFKGVKILNHFAYNTAPWNIHERLEIQRVNGKYIMSDNSALCFYHFSSYKYTAPGKMSNSYNRVSLDDSPLLKELYSIYQESILENKIGDFSKIGCVFVGKHIDYKRKNTPRSQKFKNFLKNRVYGMNNQYNRLFRK